MPDISKTFKNIEDDIVKSPTDSPIIYISAIVWVAVFMSYQCFKIAYNKITESPIPWLLNRLQFSKIILFLVLFAILLITVLFVIYILMFNGDAANNYKVAGIICVCFLSIMGTTFGLLEFAPYLVNIFENTLGYSYLFLPILFWKKDMDIHKFSEMFEPAASAASVTGAVASVTGPADTNHSYAFLITTISLLNINATITALRDLTSNFILRANKDNDNTIINNLVFLKYSVGHFVWVYFASLICTFTSIKAFAKYLPSTLPT